MLNELLAILYIVFFCLTEYLLMNNFFTFPCFCESLLKYLCSWPSHSYHPSHMALCLKYKKYISHKSINRLRSKWPNDCYLIFGCCGGNHNAQRISDANCKLCDGTGFHHFTPECCKKSDKETIRSESKTSRQNVKT